MTKWWRIAPWLAVAAYLAAIFYLSSLPNPLPALTSQVSDKVLHSVEYAALGALLAWAFRTRGVAGRHAFAAACLAASLYAATDELHQWFVPGRAADPADWAADTTGATLGAAVASRALRHRGLAAKIHTGSRQKI